MSDFLMRLTQRTLGVADVLHPAIPSIFSPGLEIGSTGISPVQSNTSINSVSEAPTPSFNESILPNNPNLKTSPSTPLNIGDGSKYTSPFFEGNSVRGLDFSHNVKSQILDHRATPSISSASEAPTSYASKSILPNNFNIRKLQAATETNLANNNLAQINHSNQLQPVITSESSSILDYKTTPTLVELNNLSSSINRVPEAPTSYTNKNILPNNSSLGTVEADIKTNLYPFNMKLQISKSPQPPLIRGAKNNNVHPHIKMVLGNHNSSQVNQSHQLNSVVTNELTRIFNHQNIPTLVELNNLSTSINRVSEAPTSYTTKNILPKNSNLETVKAATETNLVNHNLSQINQANQLNPIINNELIRIFNHQTTPTLVELNNLSTSINRVPEAPTSYTSKNILPKNSNLGTVEAATETNLVNNNLFQIKQSHQLNPVVTSESSRILADKTTPTLVELNKLFTSITHASEAPKSYTSKNILPNNSSFGIQADIKTNLYPFNMKLQITKSPQPPLIRGAKNNNVHPHIKMVLGNHNSSQVNQSHQLNSVVTNELTRIFNHQTTPTLVDLNKLSTSINRASEAPTTYTSKNILPNNSSTGAVQAATETNLVNHNLSQINQANQLNPIINNELIRIFNHQTTPTLVELNNLSTSINRVSEAPTSYTNKNILPNNSSFGIQADIKTNLYPFNMKLQITKSPQPPLIRGAKNNNVHPHIKMVLGNHNSSQVNQSHQLNSVVTNELTRIFKHQTTPTLVELNKLSTSITRASEVPTTYTSKNILPNNSSTGAVQAATETNLVKNNRFQINQSNQQLNPVIIKELTRTVDHPNAQNSNLIPPLLRGVRGDQTYPPATPPNNSNLPLVPITLEATPPTPPPRLPPPSKSVKVTIGRIDVQSAHSPEPERRRTNKSHPNCGLKDYLKRREGRSK